MTFAAETVKAGRQPVTVVELDLDTCSLAYGVSPCTAALASGLECYNTQATCQDTPNYLDEFITAIFSPDNDYSKKILSILPLQFRVEEQSFYSLLSSRLLLVKSLSYHYL